MKYRALKTIDKKLLKAVAILEYLEIAIKTIDVSLLEEVSPIFLLQTQIYILRVCSQLSYDMVGSCFPGIYKGRAFHACKRVTKIMKKNKKIERLIKEMTFEALYW